MSTPTSPPITHDKSIINEEESDLREEQVRYSVWHVNRF